MKYALLLLSFICTVTLHAQEEHTIDTAGFKTFAFQDGEDSYLMKQYYFGIYTRGDTVLHDPAEKAKTQAGHMAHLSQLGKDRKLCIAGPFGDNGDWRGIVMLSVKTEEEAIDIMNSDPAVKRGTLKYILKPVWAAVGSELF